LSLRHRKIEANTLANKIANYRLVEERVQIELNASTLDFLNIEMVSLTRVGSKFGQGKRNL